MPYTQVGVGYQKQQTSKDAAIKFEPKAATIRDQVLEILRANKNGLTAEQIAIGLGRPYGSVQPRVSELCNEGKVQDSGRRRQGSWGVQIIVWEAIQ